jgi:hypothetical protein
VVVVGPWHLPVTPAASRRVGLLDTRWGRVGAGSLPHPAGAASVILSVRLSISLASIDPIEVTLVMVDAASALAIPGLLRLSQVAWISVVVRRLLRSLLVVGFFIL